MAPRLSTHPFPSPADADKLRLGLADWIFAKSCNAVFSMSTHPCSVNGAE
jgi:hypothetical protein